MSAVIVSPATGHPTKNIPGIEQKYGCIGAWSPMAVGMAIAGKLDERPYRVFTLIGDGELAEGTNWKLLWLRLTINWIT